jgi:selenocysteine-specific elongation factor
MPEAAFDGMVDLAVAADKAVVSGNTVGHPSFGGNTDEAERAAGEAILAALAEGGMTPESLPHLLSKAVDSPSLASRALARLEKEGAVVRLNREFAFDGATFRAHVQALRDWLGAHGSGTVADLKEPLGTSRKFAVPILEYLDAHGVTRREGDSRTLQ